MKVLVVTTSRADWNSLGMVAIALHQQGEHVIVAGTRHSGFEVADDEWAKRAPDALRIIGYGHPYGARRLSVAEADAAALVGMTILIQEYKPDIALVCGDRHETLAAVFAIALAGVPIAHLAGGDVSGGSLDEGWRHAISKISNVHFPTTIEARDRLVEMGEDPARIYPFGSASVDRINETPIMPRAELIKALGLADGRDFILANWQPATPVDDDLKQVLNALWESGMPGVFVGINDDPGAAEATAMIENFLRANPRWVGHKNLPPDAYLAALAHCKMLVGNSSSGFYEAPYFATHVVNVGIRQKGRTPIPTCMVSVPAALNDVYRAICMFRDDQRPRTRFAKPYGTGAARQIAFTLRAHFDHGPMRKQFYEHR